MPSPFWIGRMQEIERQEESRRSMPPAPKQEFPRITATHIQIIAELGSPDYTVAFDVRLNDEDGVLEAVDAFGNVMASGAIIESVLQKLLGLRPLTKKESDDGDGNDQAV